MKTSGYAYALDEALYERYLRQNDREALEELVSRWKRPAFLVARCICGNPALAEEAVQETFLKILARQGPFRNQGAGSFRAWFLSLATNCARMARRAEARKKVNPREYASRKGMDARTAKPVAGRECRLVLAGALEGLAEHCRTPVVLHFMQGLRQKEVATRLGISQQMVSRRIEDGLLKLRLQLA